MEAHSGLSPALGWPEPDGPLRSGRRHLARDSRGSKARLGIAVEVVVFVPRKHPAAAEMLLDTPDGVFEHGADFAGSETPEANEDELVLLLVPGAVQEDSVEVRTPPQVGRGALQDRHRACLRSEAAGGQ